MESWPSNAESASPWRGIDVEPPARKRRRQLPGCLHDDEVLIRIDLDEIGEPDSTPSRVMVCLGCEAVRWA